MNLKCPFCFKKMDYIKGLWYHCHCATDHVYNSTMVIVNDQIVDYHLPIAFNNQIYWVDSDKDGTSLNPNIYPVKTNQYIKVSNTFTPFTPDYQIKYIKILNLKVFL